MGEGTLFMCRAGHLVDIDTRYGVGPFGPCGRFLDSYLRRRCQRTVYPVDDPMLLAAYRLGGYEAARDLHSARQDE